MEAQQICYDFCIIWVSFLVHTTMYHETGPLTSKKPPNSQNIIVCANAMRAVYGTVESGYQAHIM